MVDAKTTPTTLQTVARILKRNRHPVAFSGRQISPNTSSRNHVDPLPPIEAIVCFHVLAGIARESKIVDFRLKKRI